MWGLLPRPLQVLIIVGLGVMGSWTLSAIIGWWSGKAPPLYQAISFVASAITLVCIPLAEKCWRHLWAKIPTLNTLIFPDLNGTWSGELISTWKNPDTGEMPPPIPVTFWIKQGLFSVSVRMRTGESQSYSTRCIVEADRRAQVFRLWYGYDNRPNAEVMHRSARHEGAAWLEVDTVTKPYKLIGQYFTQRKTNGDIRLSQISKDIITTVK